MSSNVLIRRAQRQDMATVLKLIQELAEYENMADGVKLTEEDLIRDCFDSDREYFFCLLAEDASNGSIIGQAMCNYAYSSWTARAMYIEDIYVKPEYRGRKIGHRLFKEVCKIAKEKNCNRIDWHTLVDNDAAIKFYERHGAYDLCDDEKRTCYRIKRDAIDAIVDAE